MVLGAATLARLHKHVGDSVTITYGSPRNTPIYISPTRLKIVGAATLPTIGNGGDLHTSMGTGAVVCEGIEPARLQKALAQSDPNDNGPSIDVVRLKPTVSPATGLASLRRAAETATRLWTPIRTAVAAASMCWPPSARPRSSTTSRRERHP